MNCNLYLKIFMFLGEGKVVKTEEKMDASENPAKK